MRSFTCPLCSGQIPSGRVDIGFGKHWAQRVFECPTCNCSLQVTDFYAWTVWVFCSFLIVAVPYYVWGVRWYFLIVIFILGQYIVGMMYVFFVQFIPPKIIPAYPENISRRD